MHQSLFDPLRILQKTLQQTMLPDSEGTMLPRLVGLLVLISLCSAGLPPNVPQFWPIEEEGSTSELNGQPLSGSGDGASSESSVSMYPQMPPGRRPWPPGGHMSDSPDMLRMSGANHPAMPFMPDMDVCDKLLNMSVLPPVNPTQLSCICSHCKGTVGPKGDRGDRGPPGYPGSPGSRGMTGFKGRQGFTGTEGMKGQKGDLGPKGQNGVPGFIGDKGVRGFKGDKGDLGSMGLPGSQGPQGETGTCPASCESVPGAPGPQGPPGSAGARGLPGVQGSVGPKGLMGDKGDLGNPGDPGLNGLKGDQGDQGVCECTDGADGDDGIPGVKGGKGDKGDMGAPGTRGLMGLKGNVGAMGLMGQRGPCSPAIQSAFSASINQSFPVENWPVPFYNILSNRQGHFNPNMGTYTVPVNGTYVVSFHLTVVKRPLKVGLFLNHYPVFKITEVSIPATTSQTVVLHLSMGDQVWLQVKDSQTNGMYSDNESTSSFSGYLLHPDSCEFPIGRNFFPRPVNSQEDFSWDGPPGPTTPPPN